tara:strand:+ start:152 stop:712 length:561 start_codon:yes stop_codon:yes gene_type:complete
MALNINGTTGISGVDGSASAPVLTGTDSNTGINFASDTVNINTAGVTRVIVDSSGNLRAGTLTDSSGANPSTANEIAQGRAKAWIRFDGTGTVSITDSFNVSSITDNGTGDYSVTFQNNMTNANYVVLISARAESSGYSQSAVCQIKQGTTPSVSSFTIVRSYQDDNNNGVYYNNSSMMMVAVFGD